MIRIIAGIWGGRKIAVPDTDATRPTSDRVREALFARINHLGRLAGASVLDLFAGSGALGLEALSRGADQATFIDQHPAAVAAIKSNLDTLGVAAGRVLARDVVATVAQPATETFDIVLCDPPYDMSTESVEELLTNLVTNNWLVPDALIVVERTKRCPTIQWPSGYEDPTIKLYGDTRLEFAYTPETHTTHEQD